jgi:iron(III) transport system ATP-binding protein
MKIGSLSLKNIRKSFGNTVVLDDIELTMEGGQISALVGESGSGKTTLMRIIAGLEHPDAGSVFINAVESTFLTPQKRNIGLVFQDYALFPHLTVSQNITFGVHGKSKKEKQEIVADLLALVKLPELATRYPHQLSGGQQQRVAIARAIAPEPSLMLFDEPFSNLDPIRKNDLREQIKTLMHKTQTSALIVTHDIEDAMLLADTIFVIQQGSVVQSGSPLQIRENPVNQHVAKLTKSTVID